MISGSVGEGPYPTCTCLQVFGLVPWGDLGAHDSDWEHITVRLTPDGSHVTGVYYSAHRCPRHLSVRGVQIIRRKHLNLVVIYKWAAN